MKKVNNLDARFLSQQLKCDKIKVFMHYVSIPLSGKVISV